MRPSASIVRKLIQAAPLFLAALVVLLSESVADAATRFQCAARPRHQTAEGIRYHRPVVAAGSLLQNDDEQAIQNDAPAARIDEGDHNAPALRPLGLLVASFDRLPESGDFTPAAPRGPPPLP